MAAAESAPSVASDLAQQQLSSDTSALAGKTITLMRALSMLHYVWLFKERTLLSQTDDVGPELASTESYCMITS